MRVDGVERRGGTDRISLSSNGFRIAASVSRASARELGLQPGSEVVALFKATSVTVASAMGVPSGV
jgi:molybdopterin-binding protein